MFFQSTSVWQRMNLPDGVAESACFSSATTLHPIHLSIGVSRSESISVGGAEKASLTPSKSPLRDVAGLALLGCAEKAETVVAVNRRIVEVFIFRGVCNIDL